MRVVSGIQPTGNLHLGNYLGAIVNWVKMQEESECLFFLADLHAISMPIAAEDLSRATREMAAALIASGVDPERATLFNQARVPAHPELAWLLNGTARMGWLNRMTQFKDKSGKNREGASAALFAYPVLQAADVLLYRATHVPVGDDQKQHLELARDIAEKFNNDTGTETFVLPEPYIGETAARIMSLRDGTKKMSKSDPSDMSRINLSDDTDLIAKKIRKAKTDAEPLPDTVEELAGRPEARNLVTIYAALAGTEQSAVLADYAGKGFGDFKPALADLTVSVLGPISDRFNALKSENATLDTILDAGAEKATAAAAPVLSDAYRALGLLSGR
ncbi:tryptophan--tRNA ligase [Parasphingopyxis lamellibrachiae]|uniref:Tryptophan--tRNA ligase n=1 Tax=Parasphingopyxis lamellibrachiae TaxID=680125 RepID=A0A3D9FBY2_9SPHN|nr:tryptophan--tRNA ligase [Parasphingopyxis lamellibrachiae]RED15324.1 tryptophanyl-tRNA synthetase [Parasphingopyxis lamellibrachiae]